MKKIQILILLVIIFELISSIALSNVSINVKVNNEIISNYDIYKESQYLKILNSNLNKLDNKKILQLARNSLINEVIKKKEILKFTTLKKNNSLIDSYISNLYKKLNLNNINEFENLLTQKESYTIEEIKNKINIEIHWNELIYSKYISKVKISKDALKKKINQNVNQKQKEYLISEIIFNKKKDISINDLNRIIFESIKEIGFENTANIYSTSNTSKLGGKVGWINEKNLSPEILKVLNQLDNNNITQTIKIGRNFIILKVDDAREINLIIDKEKELNQLIEFEKNKQLNQFSGIYFEKSKINYSINEY
ncbi:peptidylprolyl isomerase [Candidatus Pelagibacter sp.]|nr:peptidylprolyl isomerase [Candidatus Pelagibacter sp.]